MFSLFPHPLLLLFSAIIFFSALFSALRRLQSCAPRVFRKQSSQAFSTITSVSVAQPDTTSPPSLLPIAHHRLAVALLQYYSRLSGAQTQSPPHSLIRTAYPKRTRSDHPRATDHDPTPEEIYLSPRHTPLHPILPSHRIHPADSLCLIQDPGCKSPWNPIRPPLWTSASSVYKHIPAL